LDDESDSEDEETPKKVSVSRLICNLDEMWYPVFLPCF
jgi:hypothetical protein